MRLASASCSTINVGENVGYQGTLTFFGQGKRFTVDTAGFSPTATSFPIDPGDVGRDAVRFSIADGGDYLNWGAGLGGTSSADGTIILLITPHSGGFYFTTLPFLGDDNGTVPVAAHQPILIRGTFFCP